jgi:hypothetical protein
MSQLSEAEAERLSPGQATELVQLLDLQARWQNHCADPAKSAASAPELHVRQKAFDQFQSTLRLFGAKYRNAGLPEPTQNVPDRLALWCRVLRAVYRRAEGGNPTHVLAKVYRLADRLAARLGATPVGRGAAQDVAAAVRELDAVIAWYDALLAPAPSEGAAA